MEKETQLSVWRDIYKVELRRNKWSLDELKALAMIMQGSMSAGGGVDTPVLGAVLAQECEDTPTEDLAAVGINKESLLKQLNGLGYAQDYALRVALRRLSLEDKDFTAVQWKSVGIRAKTS